MIRLLKSARRYSYLVCVVACFGMVIRMASIVQAQDATVTIVMPFYESFTVWPAGWDSGTPPWPASYTVYGPNPTIVVHGNSDGQGFFDHGGVGHRQSFVVDWNTGKITFNGGLDLQDSAHFSRNENTVVFLSDDVIVQEYTKAGLPTAGIRGRLARVTDNVRGLWMDTGTQWVKVMPYVDLKDFGAVGDNTTDDTTAVQNWLNAVQSSGLEGYASPGRYKLTAQVSVNLSNDQPFVLRGSNRASGSSSGGTSFYLAANLLNNDTPMMLIDGASQESYVNISGIGFAGANYTGSGLKIQNVGNRVTIEQCKFIGFLGRGLWTYAIIGVNVIGVHADSNGTGWDHGGVSSVGEGAVVGSKFAQNTVRNVYVNTGSSFLTFNGCTFYGNTPSTAGVELAHAVFSIGFYQCNFESGTPGIYVAAGNQANRIVIEGNAFNPSAAFGETKYAIDIAGTLAESRISNNSIDASVATGGTVIGIRIATSTRNRIELNTFGNSGGGTLTNYSLPVSAAAHYGIDSTGTTQKLLSIDQGIDAAILSSGTTFTLAANGGVQNLRGFTGGILVVRGGPYAALFTINNSAVTEVSDPSGLFATASGTANRINVYWDTTDGRVEIQNKHSVNRTIGVVFIGFP